MNVESINKVGLLNPRVAEPSDRLTSRPFWPLWGERRSPLPPLFPSVPFPRRRHFLLGRSAPQRCLKARPRETFCSSADSLPASNAV
jgi:hypothetical protein